MCVCVFMEFKNGANVFSEHDVFYCKQSVALSDVMLEAKRNQIREVCMNCRSGQRQNSVMEIMEEGVVS